MVVRIRGAPYVAQPHRRRGLRHGRRQRAAAAWVYGPGGCVLRVGGHCVAEARRIEVCNVRTHVRAVRTGSAAMNPQGRPMNMKATVGHFRQFALVLFQAAIAVLAASTLTSDARAQCEVTVIYPPTGNSTSGFGSMIDLDGDVLAVAAYNECFIYRRRGRIWHKEGELFDPVRTFPIVRVHGDRVALCSNENGQLDSFQFLRFVDGYWIDDGGFQAPIEGVTAFDFFGDTVVLGSWFGQQPVYVYG